MTQKLPEQTRPDSTRPASTQPDQADDPSPEGVTAMIARIYEALANVTVVTVVGGTTVDLTQPTGEKIRAQVRTSEQAKPFVTQLDLVEGDLVTSVPADVEELPSVLALHQQNVNTAVSVLPGNLQALIDAGRQVIDLLEKRS